ncbi:hypothetical protein [Acetobacter senegalensis]|uniref:Uncharacterized protein n=1 Tax=Acetobacter senegalensis TaxID=446692 RepID=A0A0U5EYI5_9PROT|nr:hypothetical protein [Acetobacter senegalensis]MCG4257814.1 hypothetical protein [Acetobacter senegalensis]MCG4260417.1 hypothetical protein [Acetobacter senegalensis]MCG4267281.1 hypothetical protein [Acetobacter senegalensis]MCG4271755.1 hypothetical protein [Acetobacter senegalensis]MCP1197126.1 hypothetical protein [Acetobacter senegalensis]
MTNSDQIVVSPVSGTRQLALFIRLPRLLYSGLPSYVPPLDMEQKGMLHPKRSRFFEHGTACYFLAWRNGKPIGRISAQIDRLALEQDGPRTGFFGALDAVETECVKPLLDAATDWLRLQGIERIRGPWTLNYHGESGTMIEGQMEPPMVGTGWHPETLGPAIERAGFAKAMDLLSYRMEVSPVAERANRVPANLRARLGAVTVRGLRKDHIIEDADILRDIYNDAWAGTWGNVPITRDEVQALLASLKPVLKPEQYVLVEFEGEPVAIALVVPNIFDISGDLNGAPSPLGWVKLGSRILTHDFHSARVILLGVKKKLAGTALSAIIPALLIDELMQRGHVLPYRSIELGWVLETNVGIRNLIERIVPTPYKKHRMYEKNIS